MIVDNFYTLDEQHLIWQELETLRDIFTLDKKLDGYGVAKDSNNTPLTSLKRIYLDDTYLNKRQDSKILSLYHKIISQEVLENYRNTTPSWRQFEITNNDCSLVSYYDDSDDYKEHFDSFMHTAFVWFYKTPKRFEGGNLIFSESNAIVECEHNRMVIFPSYYLHKVDKIKMKKKYRNKGLGRYCITHFYNKV